MTEAARVAWMEEAIQLGWGKAPRNADNEEGLHAPLPKHVDNEEEVRASAMPKHVDALEEDNAEEAALTSRQKKRRRQNLAKDVSVDQC